jgi:hypothetical protein
LLILKNKQNNKQINNDLPLNNINKSIDLNIIKKNITDKNNKNIKKISNSEKSEYDNIIFYPSSKEWYSSVYSYNKSYIKSIVIYDIILNKFIRSYANMVKDKIVRMFKRRRTNWKRYSGNKLHISRAELKHTSTNIFITLYVYNKKKLSFYRNVKEILALLRLKKLMGKRRRVFSRNIIRKLFYFFKNKLSIFKKWNITYFKPIDSLKEHSFLVESLESVMTYLKPSNSTIKEHNFLLNNTKLNMTYSKLIVNLHEYHSLVSSLELNETHSKLINSLEEHTIFHKNSTLYIPYAYVIFLQKLFMLQNKLFTLITWINFERSKFNSLFFKLGNLGLTSLVEKLYNKKVEINLIELKSIHLNSDVFSSAVALKLRNRKNNVLRILRKAIIQMVKIPDLHTLITFDDNMEKVNKNNIIKTLKQQVVSGVRFEASGRLTRRLTAMRAVFKYGYAGSLKSIRTSLSRKPSTMLRGYVKSNSQYTLINSKTRNGTFGLKGWVSSH